MIFFYLKEEIKDRKIEKKRKGKKKLRRIYKTKIVNNFLSKISKEQFQHCGKSSKPS